MKLPLHLATPPSLCFVVATSPSHYLSCTVLLWSHLSTSLPLLHCAPLQLYLSTSLPLLRCAPLQLPLHSPPCYPSIGCTPLQLPLQSLYPSFAMICCSSYLSISLPLIRYDVLQLPLHHTNPSSPVFGTSPPLYPSFAATSPPRYPSFTALRCSYPSTSLPLFRYDLLQLSLHLATPTWLCSVTATSPTRYPSFDAPLQQLVPPNFTTFALRRSVEDTSPPRYPPSRCSVAATSPLRYPSIGCTPLQLPSPPLHPSFAMICCSYLSISLSLLR